MKAAFDPTHTSGKEHPQHGAEVTLASGKHIRIKLRKKWNSDALLGIVLAERDGNRSREILRYDIRPDLDAVTRQLVEQMLTSIFPLLVDPGTFEQGVDRLEKLVASGHSAKCRITPIKG